jgi:hypothetical protein
MRELWTDPALFLIVLMLLFVFGCLLLMGIAAGCL